MLEVGVSIVIAGAPGWAGGCSTEITICGVVDLRVTNAGRENVTCLHRPQCSSWLFFRYIN